jgi:hypothetical protein
LNDFSPEGHHTDGRPALIDRWSKKVWRNEIDNAQGCAAIPIKGYAFSYVIKDERLKQSLRVWPNPTVQSQD